MNIYHDTHYYGIYLQHTDKGWWIISSNDDEMYIGLDKPTRKEIDRFRDSIMGGN